MGACTSCMRLLLDAEADVKIHVIEPTSINNGEGASVATRDAAPQSPAPPPLATLQVPGQLRPRTPEPTDPRVANL
ncbi:Protein CBG15436 [Caenorhabditis briggsae]|uniref:Protein CBG15436 n=2 Tax=Caenorhabditis briggsae TaxID=6238 RepID=A8XMA5_CAEBR|nr:Protein CBG15436 [Caenorhabditis briggsae]ULT83920.1 hypothetical protein L3Y34_012900 [Caenorhabditis briggsae]CAP33780.1 Protein CBG15436 [Caenorhabditis briggsae]